MKRTVCAFLLLALSTAAFAVESVDQRNIRLLASGGDVTLKQVSQSLYHSGETNTAVLDVVAEQVLNGYQTQDAGSIDALAWACRALGKSGDARYRGVLQEVEQNAYHRKLKKYASGALRDIPRGARGEPYEKGMVDIAKLREATEDRMEEVQEARASGDVLPITEITEGMSMQEVYALVGQPTASYTRQTGKAFKPFNFGGQDVTRTIALYKGQGRIVFSLESTYSGVYRVLEVQHDPNESGYP